MATKVTRDDVLKYLEKANMLEISELISEIEEKFGVTASAPIAVAAAGSATAGEAETASRMGLGHAYVSANCATLQSRG